MAVLGLVSGANAMFVAVPGGIEEHFDGTTQDTATWTASTVSHTVSFTQSGEMEITATGSAGGDVAGRGQYETNDPLVSPGDLVRVEITPNSAFPARGGGNNGHALILSAEGLGFDHDGGSFIWLRWVDGGYFNGTGDIAARARVGGNVAEAQVVSTDHPLDTTYIYEIARSQDGKSATFSVYDTGLNVIGTPQSLDFSAAGFSPIWGDLRIVLNEFHRSSTFDNVFISETPEPTAVALLALGGALVSWRRRK